MIDHKVMPLLEPAVLKVRNNFLLIKYQTSQNYSFEIFCQKNRKIEERSALLS